MVREHGADFVIVNGENADDGFGITPETAVALFKAGAQVITTGNHVWQKEEVFDYLDRTPEILRPANYPPGTAGHGSCVVEAKGARIAVINAQGRERMWPIDCPFRTSRELVKELAPKSDAIIVDFHAESPREKEALAHYLGGQIAAVFGTHTHTQTADERVFPSGTAFMTDIGMSGPPESVIGFEPETGVKRATTQVPHKNEVMDRPALLCGARIEVDLETGLAMGITRIRKQSLV
jgi:hypothetical protein